MALRIPGPLGFPGEFRNLIDPGTLARTLSPLPVPAGLAFWSPVPNQVRTATKTLLGITVNAGSRVSGTDWKAKIDKSPDVPDYFKKQITWKGGQFTTPAKFTFPSDVIEKMWLEDWLTAFNAGDWELSTHHLEVKAEPSGKVSEKVVPHLSKDEGVGGKLTNEWRTVDDIELTLGWTLEKAVRSFGATLTSGRGLIIVATEIQLSMKDGKRDKTEVFKVADNDFVRTWFHEIAVHAGRITAGKSNTHGDRTVDRNAKDIDEMFTGEKIVEKVAAAIKTFFGGPKPPGKP
jgi:hypothetical protein